MTDAANELTLDASKGALSGAGGAPYLLASVVRGMFELAVGVGLDPAALLERMEVDAATLADTNARVTQESLFRIWDAVGELPNAEHLSIVLAQGIQIDRFGVIGWAMMNAPVAGDLIRITQRFQSLFGDPIVPAIDETPDGMTIHKVFEPRIARVPVAIEFHPANTVALFRMLTDITPADELVREVWFQHAAPPDPSQHERFFGAPIRWSAPETRLVLARSAIERPILRRNPELFAYLEKHARALEAVVGASPTLASRVRAFILDTLKGTEPTPAAAAKHLGLGERTLQRRLKDEGRTFADILDEVRRELAVRYLSEPNLAIFEIAFMLGYAETSPFHRAFKRWTNESPTEFRARLK